MVVKPFVYNRPGRYEPLEGVGGVREARVHTFKGRLHADEPEDRAQNFLGVQRQRFNHAAFAVDLSGYPSQRPLRRLAGAEPGESAAEDGDAASLQHLLNFLAASWQLEKPRAVRPEASNRGSALWLPPRVRCRRQERRRTGA